MLRTFARLLRQFDGGKPAESRNCEEKGLQVQT